jgi:tetratricopeptide (TPR) repeat protein
VWDLESGRELITLRGQGVSVVDAQFNATGDRVVTAMGGGTTRVWDAANGRELVTLRGHDAEVVAATFTPSGDRLVTASFDGTIRVWDGVSCRERFAAIAAARAAESVMRGRVAERLLSGLPPGDVARWLAEDPTLNDVHRNAGRIVLNEERERRQQAQDQKRIEARRLNAAAWEVVVRPNAPLAALDRALTQAQRAVELFPARPDYVHTLGVAQYRAGRFADAIVTLTRADEMHAKSPDGPQPVDWAVIAMARYKLGKLEESKAALGRARELMQDSRHSGNEEDVAFVREAASLIEAAP